MIKILSVAISALFSVTPAAGCYFAAGNLHTVPPSPVEYGDYGNGSFIGTEDVTMPYVTKFDDVRNNAYGVPTFYAFTEQSCAVTAGGNAIIYYDRLFDELVPNYTVTLNEEGKAEYGPINAAAVALYNDLSARMGTSAGGTTVEGFKSGMTEYVASKGRSITFTKVTGNYCNIDWSQLRTHIRANKLAVVFVNTFSLTPFNEFIETYRLDSAVLHKYSGTHVMLVYGYHDVHYFNIDGTKRGRNTYLHVVTGGVSATEVAMSDITRYCTVDDVYLLEIA